VHSQECVKPSAQAARRMPAARAPGARPAVVARAWRRLERAPPERPVEARNSSRCPAAIRSEW